MSRYTFLFCLFISLSCKIEPSINQAPSEVGLPDESSRNISRGKMIFQDGYVDQPYVTVLSDGRWFCCMTANNKYEGASNQRILASISNDQGTTWSSPVPIESDGSRCASWAMPYLASSGRLFVFYVYNGDGVAKLNGKAIRNDMLGWYCFRYSDDAGATWSSRYRIPIRQTKIDLENDWNGNVQMFWGIGKPIHTSGGMYFGFSKIGKYLFDNTEGWIMSSKNIDTESDPQKIIWNQLPEGDEGIRSVAIGSIQEEQNLVQLSDGTLYCVYRTGKGYPAFTISRNDGKSWNVPEPITYEGGKNILRHTRACPRIWKCNNGKYLLWFHNTISDKRNPAWLVGGYEKDGIIQWSQPEILLYSTDEKERFSYPDLIEADGKYWFTETNKSIARLHEIDPIFLDQLWSQGKQNALIKNGILWSKNEVRSGGERFPIPFQFPNLSNDGFTLEFRINLKTITAGQVLVDTRSIPKETSRGVLLFVDNDHNITLQLNNGSATYKLSTDPFSLKLGSWHHVAFVVDGKGKIITSCTDGKLSDGGYKQLSGWVRFNPDLADINSPGELEIAPALKGEIKSIRVYNRYLRTSEIISNYLSGL